MRQIQELLQERKARGYEIANTRKVVNQNGVWVVPSATNPRQTYRVELSLTGAKCNCPDFLERGIRCKHIFAVDITITKQFNADGTITETATVRKTYPQMWHEYTASQTNEGRLFKELLKDLVENVAEQPYVFGRPKVPLKTSLFCAIDKVYSMQSSRRAYSRYKEAEAKQQIGKAPNYNKINKTLNNAEIIPILKDLLHITALPLKSVETKFSPDSTGFRTTMFNEYCKEKHGTKKEHKWIKCHAMTGNTTNIITDVAITGENGGDSPQFIPLLNTTSELGFSMNEVSADKAYNSMDNYNAVNAVGGTAYIPFKSNTTATAHNTKGRGKLWRRAFHYFQLNQDDFLMHYHNRSNVETTFFAIKTKFGDCLKNKTFVSQTNELLCKLIAYNITVLISAMYELKIEPKLLSA